MVDLANSSYHLVLCSLGSFSFFALLLSIRAAAWTKVSSISKTDAFGLPVGLTPGVPLASLWKPPAATLKPCFGANKCSLKTSKSKILDHLGVVSW